MARKAERLLNLVVMLLETSRPVTVQEIYQTIPGYGQSWDAFKRMFERDKEELREMGIPLELAPVDSWETEEGYLIPKDRYYLPDLQLQPEEVAALWLAAGLVRVNDPATFQSASIKLGLDANSDQEAAKPPITADLSLAEPNLPRAFEAATRRKSVTFDYFSHGEQKTRTVDPYGLVHRKGIWYLAGRDHSTNELRSFRLERVRGTLRLSQPGKPSADFEVPADFNAETALEAPPFVQGMPLMQAKVRFEASAAWWVERASPWLHLQRNDDGSATATVEVTDVTGFISWLLSFGESAEVVEPRELRKQTAKRLMAICG